jgi:hypothetical protein
MNRLFFDGYVARMIRSKGKERAAYEVIITDLTQDERCERCCLLNI